MPISLERVAQQFVRERSMRAVLEAWRSSVLLLGRVERRWKKWTAFNGHLLRACMRFWHMPWDGDARAAFDAWRSFMYLSQSISYHTLRSKEGKPPAMIAIHCDEGVSRAPALLPSFVRRWGKRFGISRRQWISNVSAHGQQEDFCPPMCFTLLNELVQGQEDALAEE